MNKIIQSIKSKFFPVLSVFLFVGLSVSFSWAAAQKILHQTKTPIITANIVKADDVSATTQPATDANQLSDASLTTDPGSSAQSAPIVSKGGHNQVIAQSSSISMTDNLSANKNIVKIPTPTPTAIPTVTPTPTPANTNNTNANTSNNVFTLAMLATHNQSGNCYIAYKGTVYDLSNSAAWAGCQHHGATGGIDVTPIFPHPASYFNSIPVVGTLSTTIVSNNTNNNTNTNNNSNTQNTNNSTSTTSTTNTNTNNASSTSSSGTGSTGSTSGQGSNSSGSGQRTWTRHRSGSGSTGQRSGDD